MSFFFDRMSTYFPKPAELQACHLSLFNRPLLAPCAERMGDGQCTYWFIVSTMEYTVVSMSIFSECY